MFYVVLKSVTDENQRIVLSKCGTKANAEDMKKSWRRLLGGKNWILDRRPGLDTLDHLGLTIETELKRMRD